MYNTHTMNKVTITFNTIAFLKYDRVLYTLVHGTYPYSH